MLNNVTLLTCTSFGQDVTTMNSSGAYMHIQTGKSNSKLLHYANARQHCEKTRLS